MPMEGTRRRRTRKAIWDPTEDTRPQWREALTTRVLYREVCGLAARENGLAHLSLEDVVGKIAVHMRRDVSELEARDEAIAALELRGSRSGGDVATYLSRSKVSEPGAISRRNTGWQLVAGSLM